MISFIITIAIVGLIVWAITTYIPMDAKFKQLIIVIAVICIVIWFLQVIGATSFDAPMPRIN